ncbi:MAG: hypothetical protein Q8L14_15195 [Myxococcales bacterium]|nr:hypothetical protein [Myxococcales bacterium]
MSCLSAGPIALALFTFAISGSEEDGLSRAWLEGGWPMYLITGLGLFAALVNAVGLFFATRGSPFATGAGLFLSTLVSAAGVFGYRSGMTGSFKAIAHAAPMDQPIIMNGATGESMMCLTLAAVFAGGLFLSVGVGALIGSAGSKPHRAALALFGLGALALGLWQSFLSVGFGHEAGAFTAVAHASPGDVEVILFSNLELAQKARSAAMSSLLGAAVVCLIAGATLRRSPRALLAVIAGVLVSAVGLGGSLVAGRPSAEELALLATPDLASPLRPVAGGAIDRRERFLAVGASTLRSEGSEPIEIGDSAEVFAQVHDVRFVVNLKLERDVTLGRVLDVLTLAQNAGVRSARLIGSVTLSPPPGVAVPPPFDAHLSRLGGVRVLLASDETCASITCEFGTWSEKGVTIGQQTLPRETSSSAYDSGEVDFSRAIHLRVGGLTLEQLFDATHTVAAESRILALHLQ